MSLSPVEQLAHSTVRIECSLSDGRKSTGTGFFFALLENDEQHVPVIVTNKHVVAGAVEGNFLLTLKDKDGNPNVGNVQRFELDQFEQRWVPHPNPEVDLCVMPIAPLVEEGPGFFYVSLNKALVPTEEDVADMIGLERIVMVGYPNGLWDEVNNLPIFRNGVLATDYKYDWNGKPQFVIDAACFPGSSGSPVIQFEIGQYFTRGNLQIGGSRIKFLGILYAGPQHTVEGDIVIVDVPTQQLPKSYAGIPNNLGLVIKSHELDVFHEMFAQHTESN